MLTILGQNNVKLTDQFSVDRKDGYFYIDCEFTSKMPYLIIENIESANVVIIKAVMNLSKEQKLKLTNKLNKVKYNKLKNNINQKSEQKWLSKFKEIYKK